MQMMNGMRRSLLASLPNERLSISMRPSLFIPFLLADPQLMERPQACNDTTTQPPAVSAFSRVARCMYFDMWEVPSHFIAEPFAETGKECPAACENNVAHENTSQIGLASAQRIGDELRHALGEIWIRGSQLPRVRKELFTDRKPFWPKVLIVSCGELVLLWGSRSRSLVIPSLVQNPSDALDPLIDLVHF